MSKYFITNVNDTDVLEIRIQRLSNDTRGQNYVLADPELSMALEEHTYTRFVQWNLTRSVKHSLRGMHLQIPPNGQGKLVILLKGKIRDAWIDMRQNSLKYLYSGHLDLDMESSLNAIYIPPGYAHGFEALEDSTVLYGLTTSYEPRAERSICYNSCRIDWIEPKYLSKKDAGAPTLDEFLNTL